MTTDQAYEATEQAREFGERAAGNGRLLGRLAVDTYEQAVNSAVEFERKTADAAPADWIKTAVGAHAGFVAEVNAAYIRAIRSVIS